MGIRATPRPCAGLVSKEHFICDTKHWCVSLFDVVTSIIHRLIKNLPEVLVVKVCSLTLLQNKKSF